MWKSCAGTGVQCLLCLVPLLSPDTLSENREEKHIIRWTDIWDLSRINAIPHCPLFSGKGCSSVYRATAEAVNTLTPVSISAQLVGKMVKTVGTKYAQYEEMQAEQTETDPQPQAAPEYLYVEGDGVMLQEQHTKERQMEMHRFQAATGWSRSGNAES